MIREEATNLEVFREAKRILDDFEGIDTYWYEDKKNFCAVTAVIVYQLLKKGEDKNESI